VKITAKAGDLAEALALAELALSGLTPETAKKVLALSAVRIIAMDGVVSFTSNILDFAVTTKAQVEIIEPGEGAVSLKTLATLVTGFPKDAAIIISAAEKMVTVTGGNGRFRLQTIPIETMPAALEIVDQDGSIELEAADLLRLLAVTAAASTETTRYYLNGILLHTVGDEIAAVGTDGRQLMRAAVAADTFSTNRGLIVPLKAATIIQKILRKTKPEKIVLRRSKALLMAQAPDITLVTKLVAAEFPAYECIIPQASANTITCDGDDLVASLRRLAAIATKIDVALAALRWQGGQDLEVFLARQVDDACDVVAAEITGSAQITVPISQLITLLEQIDGDTISLSTDGTGPLLIKRVGDDRFLALQTLSQFHATAT
jgi:DNA polymerase III subunit beta